MTVKKAWPWIAIAVVVLIIAGGGGDSEPEPAAQQGSGSSSITTSAPAPPPPEPEEIELSGKGDYASNLIELETGLSVFVIAHNGQSNFIVQLLDAQGGLVDLLVNQIGAYQGVVGRGVIKGKYVLSINADGQWGVVVMQPRPAAGSAPPLETDGKGDFVLGPMQLSRGLARFELTHDGTSNFVAVLLDGRGQWVDLLVNEIGSYTGSQAIGVPKTGVYWLAITADGSWTMKVTQ